MVATRSRGARGAVSGVAVVLEKAPTPTDVVAATRKV